MTRGDFLRAFASTAAVSLAGCRCPFGCSSGERPIALQLFSIHRLFWQNPEANLVALKEMGYDGVEFYDFKDYTARQIRAMIAGAGLRGAGTHLNGDVKLVGDELRRTLDFCAEAGFESITTPHAKRDSADAYRKFGHDMGLAAEAAAKYGIKVGIHSTYHHFTTKYGSETAWDMIYKDASPLLRQQIDTGNTFHTGVDLVALLKKYPHRHHSVHAKENVPTVDGTLGVPPKDGGPCVPWAEVVSYLKTEPELKWWIVEAEGRPDSLEPAAKCRKILRDWIG